MGSKEIAASSKRCPGGRTSACLNGVHATLSRRDECYGLICHSKYTNPTATAETTMTCMNPSLRLIVVTCPTLETSARVMGIVRWVFRQLISRFWMSGMRRRGALKSLAAAGETVSLRSKTSLSRHGSEESTWMNADDAVGNGARY